MNEDKNKEELEFNKQNREDFENLMEKSSMKKDDYWDSNSPILRIVLLIIGAIIVVGSAYIIIQYMNK